MTTRMNWDEYFITIAKVVASRATCPRAHVGAVLVKDRRILATGYNGSPPGESHCIDVGCEMENGHCIRTIHAELNCLMQASKFGIPIDGATMYMWGDKGNGVEPCLKCNQAIKAAGIIKIITKQEVSEIDHIGK